MATAAATNAIFRLRALGSDETGFFSLDEFVFIATSFDADAREFVRSAGASARVRNESDESQIGGARGSSRNVPSVRWVPSGTMRSANGSRRALADLVVHDGPLAALGAAFAERRMPTPLPAPHLVAFNPDAAALLGLDPAAADDPDFTLVAAGNATFRDRPPSAAIYAGHQFGIFVPQLGDGRAISLGEIENALGERWEFQLKGAGTTAFSRFADGRAVLRSTIREYLCSEAMHHLGIPTTRALAIAGSAFPVFRERTETAAVLIRLAPSFVRFGSFELFHSRGQFEHVKTLADHTIARLYPALAQNGERERYAGFLREVVERTAELVARWQAAGFAHGVLNTDNMSILGLTLDYGPFGFMERFDPGFICNHSDEAGRYAFDQQPRVGHWNCYVLASALSSLVERADAQAALDAYVPAYRSRFFALMGAKLGLAAEEEADRELIAAFLDVLEASGADYTLAFRRLGSLGREARDADVAFDEFFGGHPAWSVWRARYSARLEREPRTDAARRAAMARVNPKFVLRNHLAQRAIVAAEAGDFGEIGRLHAVLRAPFAEQPENEAYARPAPEGTETPEVSCSS